MAIASPPHYRKKFQAGRKYIPNLFRGIDLPEEIEQIAVFILWSPFPGRIRSPAISRFFRPAIVAKRETIVNSYRQAAGSHDVDGGGAGIIWDLAAEGPLVAAMLALLPIFGPARATANGDQAESAEGTPDGERRRFRDDSQVDRDIIGVMTIKLGV